MSLRDDMVKRMGYDPAEPSAERPCVCRQPSDPPGICGEPSDAYMCTRPAGHKGKHVACGFSMHLLAEWGSEP